MKQRENFISRINIQLNDRFKKSFLILNISGGTYSTYERAFKGLFRKHVISSKKIVKIKEIIKSRIIYLLFQFYLHRLEKCHFLFLQILMFNNMNNLQNYNYSLNSVK